MIPDRDSGPPYGKARSVVCRLFTQPANPPHHAMSQPPPPPTDLSPAPPVRSRKGADRHLDVSGHSRQVRQGLGQDDYCYVTSGALAARALATVSPDLGGNAAAPRRFQDVAALL